jgi:hypothetical protein
MSDPSWMKAGLDAARETNGRIDKGQRRSSDEPFVVPDVRPEDVATIDDLIRAGSEVSWLWHGWIQRGVLTAVAAKAGTGKTRFCADILRRARHHLPWPDGAAMTLPADALALWVVSDNHHDEMVTLARDFDVAANIRINAARTDPYGGVTLETVDDYCELEARVKAVQPAIVVIDTVGNATDKNLSRQEDAKAFYQPLQILARRYRCAVLCLTHLNATGQFLGRRVLEKVRVALRMEHYDGNEKRRFEVHKTNSRRPAPLGLTMGDRGNEYDNDPPEPPDPEAGKFGPSAHVQEAIEWLRGRLASGARRVSHLRDEAKDADISAGCLYRAKELARIREYDSEGKKWWALTSDDSE